MNNSGPAVETEPLNAWWKQLPAVAGYAAIAAAGLLLGFPVLMGELLARQVVGRVMDAPWTPFGTDPEGKTQLSILVVAGLGLPLLLGTVLIARAVRRRLGPGQRTTAAHYAVSLVLLSVPILVARAALTH